MNLTINVLRTNSEQLVTVGVIIDGDDVLIGADGAGQILQAWTDGPSKSWENSPGYLSVTKDGREYSASADDMGFWTLETLEFLTRRGIQYGDAIGDPNPKVQARIQELLAERGLDMPEARVTTNAIVATLIAEGLM
ncbi:hypothetical protein QDA03_gp65 [Microbacterium phage Terij]|uniref:Uncharacterized protein n=1 Tax=Microbacterium phage Terij TaxID=2686229 RepID=A0A6B9L6N5_9CAUD|nr:hypothetical protein QDA03_gp65 [Microbacterium phage Terij]QHB37176.1 hypothetical protein SEA_TERIJ_42 [Microbacterium phage Terij]